MKSNINTDDLTKNLSPEQQARVHTYQKIHSRLKILRIQMDDIKDETQDLIETLEKLRIEDKNNIDNGKKE